MNLQAWLAETQRWAFTASEVREQTKALRSSASQRAKWNLGNRTDGGHPAAPSGEAHIELFSHLGQRCWTGHQGTDRFGTGTAKGCPVWASLASVAAALPKAGRLQQHGMEARPARQGRCFSLP